MTGHPRGTNGWVVTRLHIFPCPSKHKDIVRMSPDEIIDTFWNEYKIFNTHDEDFSNEARWNTPDVAAGRSYLWHEKYSLPYTKILGFVACRVTLKVFGIGAAERCWSGVKDIKTGKRSGLSGASTERRSILYTTARITEARINREAMGQIDAGQKRCVCCVMWWYNVWRWFGSRRCHASTLTILGRKLTKAIECAGGYALIVCMS